MLSAWVLSAVYPYWSLCHLVFRIANCCWYDGNKMFSISIHLYCSYNIQYSSSHSGTLSRAAFGILNTKSLLVKYDSIFHHLYLLPFHFALTLFHVKMFLMWHQKYVVLFPRLLLFFCLKRPPWFLDHNDRSLYFYIHFKVSLLYYSFKSIWKRSSCTMQGNGPPLFFSTVSCPNSLYFLICVLIFMSPPS